jgi:hypothetical protein
MKSNKEIRQVLIDYDQSASKGNNSGSALFGTGKAPFVTSASSGEATAKKLLYEGLGVEGSPIVMNIEMNKESSLNPYSDVKEKEKTGSTGTKKGGKSSSGAVAGGAKKGKAKK